MNCDVIRDLLPLRADGLTSPTSNACIDAHLQTCETCRALWDSMTAPLESPAEHSVPDYITALHKQRNRNRIIVALLCTCIPLAALLGYWIYRETHFSVNVSQVVSTSPDQILSEMPELELRQEEKELARQIFQLPAVHAAGKSQDLIVISPEELEINLSAYLPSGAWCTEISASAYMVYLDYQVTENNVTTRTVLSFFDGDQTGYTDVIKKDMTCLTPEETTAPLYTLTYDVAQDASHYEKTESRHQPLDVLSLS